MPPGDLWVANGRGCPACVYPECQDSPNLLETCAPPTELVLRCGVVLWLSLEVPENRTCGERSSMASEFLYSVGRSDKGPPK